MIRDLLRSFLFLSLLIGLALLLTGPASAQEPAPAREPDSDRESASAEEEEREDPVLDVLDWTANTTDNHVEITGRVRNISNQRLDDVVVEVTFLFSTGGRYRSGRSSLQKTSLGSGEVSAFKVRSWWVRTDSDIDDNRRMINKVTLRFRTAGGDRLEARNAEGRPGSGGNSAQLDATERQVERRLEERRREEAEEKARAARLLPAWWEAYDEAMEPFREVEGELRKAYRAEGRADGLYREIIALEGPLLQVARTLRPAPDSDVQARVGRMLQKFALAIENARGSSWLGFQNEYAEAVKILGQLDRNR